MSASFPVFVYYSVAFCGFAGTDGALTYRYRDQCLNVAMKLSHIPLGE